MIGVDQKIKIRPFKSKHYSLIDILWIKAIIQNENETIKKIKLVNLYSIRLSRCVKIKNIWIPISDLQHSPYLS